MSTDSKITEWDLYYTTIVGWKLHPGYLKDPKYQLSLKECCELATKMQEAKKLWQQ